MKLDLIETLWNVKITNSATESSSGIDLIETLWNVKQFRKLEDVPEEGDLIETLWNVKEVADQYDYCICDWI